MYASKITALILLIAAVWIGAVSAEPVAGDLVFEQAYVRGLPPMQRVTAAFMRLVNTSDQPIIIVGATSSVSEKAEIHTHRHHNGMMRMEQVMRIVIPAHGEFIFAPGSYHLMLIGLTQTLLEGDKIVVELLAEDGRKFQHRMPVRSVLNENQ